MTAEKLYPEPPPGLGIRTPGRLLMFLGPGVIIASVTIGSGELVWASRSGAIFGYGMLWCFLYAGVFKAIQVYTATRHITLCGEHPLVSWCELPGPRMWFPLLIAVPAVALMPIAFSAIPETLAGYVHGFTGLGASGDSFGPWDWMEFWTNTWSSLVLIGCLVLAMGSSYAVFERVSIVVLGLLVCCVAVAVVVLGPDLGQLAAGLFVPRVDDYPEWLTANEAYASEFAGRSPWLEVSLYLGAVGGGAYDYIGYVGMVREKRWGLSGGRAVSRLELARGLEDPEMLRRARVWMRAPLVDVVGSFFLVILVTLLFGILGAIVLGAEQRVPVQDSFLGGQEQFLTEMHPELKWVYRGGVFLAFIGTLYGAFEVYRHTFGEAARAIVPSWSGITARRVIRWGVPAYCFLGGLTLVWLPKAVAGDITDRLTFGSILSGAGACGLWCLAMLWTDRRRLPPALQMSPLLRGLTWVAGMAMTGLGLVIIYRYFV